MSFLVDGAVLQMVPCGQRSSVVEGAARQKELFCTQMVPCDQRSSGKGAVWQKEHCDKMINMVVGASIVIIGQTPATSFKLSYVFFFSTCSRGMRTRNATKVDAHCATAVARQRLCLLLLAHLFVQRDVYAELVHPQTTYFSFLHCDKKLEGGPHPLRDVTRREFSWTVKVLKRRQPGGQ